MTIDFSAAQSEVVQICSDLIRIDTQNWGEGKANPERPAATTSQRSSAKSGLTPKSTNQPPAGPISWHASKARILIARHSSCTGIRMSSPLTPRSGALTRSAAKSRTVFCGAEVPST